MDSKIHMTFSESVYYSKNLYELNNVYAEMLNTVINYKMAITTKSLNNYALVIFNLILNSIV